MPVDLAGVQRINDKIHFRFRYFHSSVLVEDINFAEVLAGKAGGIYQSAQNEIGRNALLSANVDIHLCSGNGASATLAFPADGLGCVKFGNAL